MITAIGALNHLLAAFLLHFAFHHFMLSVMTVLRFHFVFFLNFFLLRHIVSFVYG